MSKAKAFNQLKMMLNKLCEVYSTPHPEITADEDQMLTQIENTLAEIDTLEIEYLSTQQDIAKTLGNDVPLTNLSFPALLKQHKQLMDLSSSKLSTSQTLNTQNESIQKQFRHLCNSPSISVQTKTMLQNDQQISQEHYIQKLYDEILQLEQIIQENKLELETSIKNEQQSKQLLIESEEQFKSLNEKYTELQQKEADQITQIVNQQTLMDKLQNQQKSVFDNFQKVQSQNILLQNQINDFQQQNKTFESSGATLTDLQESDLNESHNVLLQQLEKQKIDAVYMKMENEDLKAKNEELQKTIKLLEVKEEVQKEEVKKSLLITDFNIQDISLIQSTRQVDDQKVEMKDSQIQVQNQDIQQKNFVLGSKRYIVTNEVQQEINNYRNLLIQQNNQIQKQNGQIQTLKLELSKVNDCSKSDKLNATVIRQSTVEQKPAQVAKVNMQSQIDQNTAIFANMQQAFDRKAEKGSQNLALANKTINKLKITLCDREREIELLKNKSAKMKQSIKIEANEDQLSAKDGQIIQLQKELVRYKRYCAKYEQLE